MRSKLLKLLLIGVSIVAPVSAESLSGRVLDPQGAVVPNAELTLYDRNSGAVRKTTSSSTGQFNFPDIFAGKYLVQIDASDSALNGSMELEVVGSVTKDLALSLASANTRIVVSATGTPLFEQEVAKVVDVVDAQQIEQRDEYNVAEALRTVPGVIIQTQVGGVTQVRTRGLPNQYTGLLVDGLRFRDADATQGDASGFYSDINVTDQSRIEFMRGSGSSLYGTNAVGGSINLSSNDGGGKFHGALRAEGGGLGFFRGTLNASGGIKDDRFVYSGGIVHLNVTGGVRGETPNRNSSGQFFGKYNFTPTLSLSGRVWGSKVFQRSVDSPTFTPAILVNFPAAPADVHGIPLADDQLSLYERKLPFNAGNATFIPSVPDPDGSRYSSWDATAFILNHAFNPKSSWRASYQLVDTRRDYYDGPAGAGSFEPAASQVSNFDGKTQEAQLRFDTAAVPLNRIQAGYEFERESIDSVAAHNIIGGSIARTTAAQNSHSFYGQDQLSFLNNRLQIILGGRIQKYDLKNPSFTGATSPYEKVAVVSPDNSYTGDASIAYFVPTSGTKFRGHFGNGYRAPALYERFGSGFSSFSGFTYYGDPRLTSEKSISFDAGVDQYLFQSRVRASATYFYTDLNPTILFTSTGFTGDPFSRTSGYRSSPGGGISRGVELSTQISATSKTSVILAYTFVNAELRAPTIGTNFFEALRTPRNTFTVTATQWLTKRLYVTADYYAISASYESPFGAGGRRFLFPGPQKPDFVVNYRLPVRDKYSLDFYTKIDNATNRRYSDNGYLAPEAWAIAGLKFNF